MSFPFESRVVLRQWELIHLDFEHLITGFTLVSRCEPGVRTARRVRKFIATKGTTADLLLHERTRPRRHIQLCIVDVSLVPLRRYGVSGDDDAECEPPYRIDDIPNLNPALSDLRLVVSARCVRSSRASEFGNRSVSGSRSNRTLAERQGPETGVKAPVRAHPEDVDSASVPNPPLSPIGPPRIAYRPLLS